MPEMIVKQDAVRSQATLKKVEEEIDTKQSGGNKQQSYARGEQVKAQAKKQAEEADVRKKLQANEKKVTTLESKKQKLEKKVAGQKAQDKADQSPAEKAKTEHHEKKNVSAKKGEIAAKANDEKQEKVKAAQVPDKESIKAAKAKTDEAEKAKADEQAREVEADEKEAEEENDDGGKPSAASIAKVKTKAKPDASAAQLKAVKADLTKAYSEQQAMVRQLIGILTGLSGLETNLDKRRKLQTEAKTKLAEQLRKVEQKVVGLKRA